MSGMLGSLHISGDDGSSSSGAGDGTVDRVVETATTRTIEDTLSLVALDYFSIEGTGILVLEGDAALMVL